MWQERKNFLVERSSHFFPFPLWKVSWYQAEAGWETEGLFWWNTELEGSISEDPRPSLGWGWGVVVIGEERVWGALLQTERLSKWPFIECEKYFTYFLKCENLSPFLLLQPAYTLPLPKEESLGIPSWRHKSKIKNLQYDFWGPGLITLQAS